MPKALFIVGCHRSGTTLLKKILNQFPGIFISNETGFVPDLLTSYNNIRTEKDWWKFVDAVNSYLVSEQFARKSDYWEFRKFMSDFNEEGYAAFVRYVWQLDSPDPYTSLKFLGDNTPKYVMAVPLLEILFPGAFYIHIVRDPRDVVASVLPLKFGANSPFLAAQEWMERVGSWLMAERIIEASRRCEVKYEDLVSNPDNEIPSILSWLGVTSEFKSFVGRELGEDKLSKKMAHHRKTGEKIDSASVGRYRSVLSEKEVEIVEAITLPGLSAYGYRVDRLAPSPLMQERYTALGASLMVHFLKGAVRKTGIRQ